MALTSADKTRVVQEKRTADNNLAHSISERKGATKRAHVVVSTPRFQPIGGTTVSLGTNGVLQPTIQDSTVSGSGNATVADQSNNVPSDTETYDTTTETKVDWIQKIFDFITENKLLVSGFLLLIVFRKKI